MDIQSIVQALAAYKRGENLSQATIISLKDNGYVEVTEVTHLQSPSPEYMITFITEKGCAILESRKRWAGA